MRHHRLLTIAAIALALLAGSGAAYAQERFEFKIPFAFVANGTTLPAGDYYFYADDMKQVLTVESRSTKGTEVFVPIQTRISQRKGLADAELVFDKVNDQSLVAELLPPDVDGYVLLVTKTKHTHHSLKGARAKK